MTQAQEAIRSLSLGICQCTTIRAGGDWDTHNDNDEQNFLFETLFSQLTQMMTLLEETTDQNGVSLSQNTTVIVMSEMGRTPAYNITGGRDHWPFTSYLMIGEGIKGGRVVGGYTNGFMGVGVNPLTLELDEDRIGISAEEFGATLLMLAGINSDTILPNISPLTGILSST